MLRRSFLALPVLLAAGCRKRRDTAEMPPPRALTADAIGNYCGMNVLEHPGPKGQIILSSSLDPIWFSSARDVFAFTMLPEEAKDILAIYVSDMGKAESWENPGATNWIDARKAFYVIESRRRGGMGSAETIPFSDRDTAEAFVRQNGGRIVTFDTVPQDYVLGS